VRSTLDKLISYFGLALAGLLVIGGGLLLWGANFTNSNVTEQLKQQDITMPAGPAIEDPLIKPYLEKYAGQEMTTGDQAKAFADHYIKVHMDKSSGGRTYEDVSGEFITLSKDKPTPTRPRSPNWAPCARASSWATPCAACCSMPMPSARWPRS
jgi:hypothetical protein